MKRIFLLMAFLALIFPAFSRVKIGDLYYNLDNSTNTAEVTWYILDKTDNKNYVSGVITIPETVSYDDNTYSVTSIGDKAFYYCRSLTKVGIPNSVTTIGDMSFCDSGLKSLEVPNSVTTIKRRSFGNCSAIKDVKIEDGGAVLAISYNDYHEGLFYDCPLETLYLGRDLSYETDYGDAPFAKQYKLNNLTIGNTVTTIGKNAFSSCVGLTKVEIPNSVTTIGERAFYNCSGLASIEIPNSVLTIENDAFHNCDSLAKMEIPNSVTKIGDSAFYNCYSLTNLEIGNSVSSIGNEAFRGCTLLTSIDIPSAVTYIGYSVFDSCSHLENINVDIDNASYASLDGILYSKNMDRLIRCPEGKMGSVEIPNSTTIIGNAFLNCYALTKVEIPNSITEIGERAFNNCGLTEIVLESEVAPSYYSPFSAYTQKATLTIPTTADIPGYLLSEWGNFTKINQSNGDKLFLGNDGVFVYRFVENLGEAFLVQGAPYNKDITSASIPDRVVADRKGEESFYQVIGISPNAFKDCSNLSYVKLPAKCVGIGSNAFSGCSSLTDFEIPNTVNYIGASAFSGCSSLTNLEIPETITSIGDFTFYNCSGLTNIEIPNLITSIGTSAFQGCSGLTSIEIPKYVTSIGDYAFEGCSNLTSITIPNSVNNIGNGAFLNIEFDKFSLEDAVEELMWLGYSNHINAKNLYVGRNLNYSNVVFSGIESLEIGAFVEYVSSLMYRDNPNLKSVLINPGSGIVIGTDVFRGCANLVELTLPEDIAEILEGAFYGTALKTITVPNGIIGYSAFANCNLDNIILGAGVKKIEDKAFDGSNAIKAVYATPITPPSAENNTFSYYESQLYVPEESIDTYYNTTRCWYRFSGVPLVMPESIELNGPTSIKGQAGETFQLTATISPSNVTLDRILWNSTNPAIASVDNNGMVTIHNFKADETMTRSSSTISCQIIATTLYEDSPLAMVNIELEVEDAAIDYINSDDFADKWTNGPTSNDIITLQGACLKRNATQSDIDALNPGIYIIRGKKVVVK